MHTKKTMNRLTVSMGNSYSFSLIRTLDAVTSSHAFFSYNFFFTRTLVSASFYTHFLTIHI